MTISRRNIVLNLVILLATLVVVSIILIVGRAVPEPVDTTLAVGQPSPETFVANRSTEPIIDEAAVERAREEARASVPTQFKFNNVATLEAQREVARFFQDLERLAFVDVPDVPSPTTTQPPETTTTAGTSTTAGETGPTTTTTVPTTTTTTTIPRKAVEDQIAQLSALYPNLSLETVQAFVLLYNSDLDRVEEGADPVFPKIEELALGLVRDEENKGIKQGDLAEIRNNYLTGALPRPPIFVPDLPAEEQEMAASAIGELVGRSLRANLDPDDEATQAEREARAAAVDPDDYAVVYSGDDTIAVVGEPLTEVQIEAIRQLGLYQPDDDSVSLLAMALLGTIAVLLAAFFLWRIAPSQWSRPRHFALLGILLVLAALISRIPEFFLEDNRSLGYLLPAVAVGFIAAILFDPRTAVLMAIPMAAFTAISTQDLAFTVFAGASTVVPVGFVSSLSSRRQLRLAVLGSAAAAAPIAYSVEWLFGSADTALRAGLWAFVGALVAGFLGQGLVSFLENAFGVTTTLSLLDLLDRNHPALRLLEEKAPGTFNHSMLVGSLTGRAARAIGADPLLAQAAAWYHDLGKTEDPQYFIENQFGVSNPHDLLAPEESAAIIRKHVTDGLRLAKKYRIPPEVAAGIREHHGTGLMRYFYHKALEEDPTVDPNLFRHHGAKPKRKEMAILMIADAVEGASRAYAQNEDPTAEGLVRLVDTVVQEKVDDGQLDESALTFGDLTAVKRELVRALIGYYHTRVPYPGFPGPRVGTGPATALPEPTDKPEPAGTPAVIDAEASTEVGEGSDQIAEPQS